MKQQNYCVSLLRDVTRENKSNLDVTDNKMFCKTVKLFYFLTK